MNVGKNTIKIYKVNHRNLKDGELVVADNVMNAIEKFNEYYNADYDIDENDIIDVNVFCTYEVIDEFKDKYNMY